MEDIQNSIIDAHIHIWAADREAYPLAPGFVESDLWIPSHEPEEHLAIAGDLGVGRINFVQMTWYGTDHSYILDQIAAAPDRFVGTGIVPAVTDIDVGSPGKTMVALSEGGIYAFRMRGRSWHRRPIGDGPHWMEHPGYAEMFEAGARYNLVLSFLSEPSDLPEIDRMCALNPGTPVIIDHLCRIGIDGRFPDEDIRALCELSRHPNVYIKIGPFQHLGSKVRPYLDVLPLVERVIDAYGPERCMWESDSPALRPGNYDADPAQDVAASLAVIRDHADFLSASDKHHLLQGTAERLFFER